MLEIPNISQSTTMGSNNSQIGLQYNHEEHYHGLSVADATQMAFAIFHEYFPQLREELLQDLRKLVEQELKTVPSENIVPPSPRIAVPTLQNASITEEPEIRNLYAKLLANSMNSVVKDGVHPGFVEIIKQLCPDEAKILRYLSTHTTIPTVTLRYVNDKDEGIDIVKNFSNVGELAGCENPFEISKYFDNLIRLGLLESSTLSSLINKSLYEPLKSHRYILPRISEAALQTTPFNKTKFKEGYMSITDFGKSFCGICLSTTKTITIQVGPMP